MDSSTEAPDVHRVLQRALLEVTRVNGLSAVTRSLAHSPLKIVVPRSRGKSVWAFTSTFGGGLVSGDAIDLQVEAGAGTCTLLSTQASTKVYRSIGIAPTRQTLDATVAEDAILIIAPDALTCFKGSVYEQRQRFDVATTGGLVLIDWITSGRSARGERWAFHRYSARNEIDVGGMPVYRDHLLLDQQDGPIGGGQRMGRYNCMASAVLIGERLSNYIEPLLQFVAQEKIQNELLFTASPLSTGMVLRVAGPSSEAVGRWLRERLSFIVELLGDDPWARKR